MATEKGPIGDALARPVRSVYWGGVVDGTHYGCTCGQGGKCGQYSEAPADIDAVLDRVRSAADLQLLSLDAESLDIALSGEHIEIFFRR
jgi:hypothetical protein